MTDEVHEREVLVAVGVEVALPEIDVPGHVNAALASYAELTCDGHAPSLYTGVEVGFSSLCVDGEPAGRFVEEVIDEVAALTPGPYLHIGGDEARSLDRERYARFVERAQRIVQAHGKRAVGWQEIARASLLPDSIAEYWDTQARGVDTVHFVANIEGGPNFRKHWSSNK